MKLRKIILSATAAFAAFGVSLGLLEIGKYIVQSFPPTAPTEAPAIKPKPAPTIVYQPPVVDPPANAESPAPEQYCEFSADGTYALFGKNPKGFADFDSLDILTTIYSEKKNDYVAVEPYGAVQTNKEFKYSRLIIKGKKISFKTVARGGVYYQFEGKFVEEKVKIKQDGEEYEQTILLKGKLTKRQSDGAKIAEADMRFVEMCGC